MEYSTKIMSFSNEIDQQKWKKKNNAESANLFLFLNDLLSYGSRISEFASEC